MTTANPRPTWRDFVPAASLLVVLAGAALSGGGGIITQVHAHDQRIETLERRADTTEADARTRADLLQKIDLRLARIEVKLEMMGSDRADRGGEGGR